MTPEQKNLFTQYEEIKRDIAELEKQCDAIKPLLLPIIPIDTKIDTGTGVFTLSARKTWKYSDETEAMEDELKEKKKEEEQLGIAVASVGEPFIVFKAKKN